MELCRRLPVGSRLQGFSSGVAHLFAGFRLVLGVVAGRHPVVISLALLIG